MSQPYGPTLTTQTYRRAEHSVSLLHAHLAFVIKYRLADLHPRHVHVCEDIMRTVGAEPDAESVEFNGEADLAHLLVA
jgi:putative transposase